VRVSGSSSITALPLRLACSGFEHVHVIWAVRATCLGRGAAEPRCGARCAPPSTAATVYRAFRNLDRDAREDLTSATMHCARITDEPTRNNRGVAHENGGIESPHGHLKPLDPGCAADARTMDFEDLGSYRSFLDEIVGRKNARNIKRIDASVRAAGLPDTRTTITKKSCLCHQFGGFVLRKFLYGALALDPARLRRACMTIGGAVRRGTRVLSLVRPARARRKHGHVVDYHHVIHALRRKPCLLNLVYRDQLWRARRIRHMFDICAIGSPSATPAN